MFNPVSTVFLRPYSATSSLVCIKVVLLLTEIHEFSQESYEALLITLKV